MHHKNDKKKVKVKKIKDRITKIVETQIRHYYRKQAIVYEREVFIRRCQSLANKLDAKHMRNTRHMHKSLVDVYKDEIFLKWCGIVVKITESNKEVLFKIDELQPKIERREKLLEEIKKFAEAAKISIPKLERELQRWDK